jgi:spore coat protein JB
MLFDDNMGFVNLDVYNMPNLNDISNALKNNNQKSSTDNTKLVTVEEGLLRGNMFKDEYVSYKNYSYGNITPKSEREKLLLEVLEYSFAIVDLNLYLDLHPSDTTYLQKFAEIVQNSVEKEMEYVRKYGPLEVIDSDNLQQFNWIDNPWPWEKGGLD